MENIENDIFNVPLENLNVIFNTSFKKYKSKNILNIIRSSQINRVKQKIHDNLSTCKYVTKLTYLNKDKVNRKFIQKLNEVYIERQ